MLLLVVAVVGGHLLRGRIRPMNMNKLFVLLQILFTLAVLENKFVFPPEQSPGTCGKQNSSPDYDFDSRKPPPSSPRPGGDSALPCLALPCQAPSARILQGTETDDRADSSDIPTSSTRLKRQSIFLFSICTPIRRNLWHRIASTRKPRQLFIFWCTPYKCTCFPSLTCRRNVKQNARYSNWHYYSEKHLFLATRRNAGKAINLQD